MRQGRCQVGWPLHRRSAVPLPRWGRRESIAAYGDRRA
ncbi:hypothetical protein [Caulobacter vibrioides]|nr:hypothetical protein [Caulobacter vibrioides]